MVDTPLVFVDLETTGLNPNDRVIEIGILPVDSLLEPLDEGFRINIACDPLILEHMNPVVIDMHTKNGLLAELAAGEALWVSEAIRQSLDYLNKWGQPGQIPLTGSSVHFDRKFMAKWMPQVEAWFHYRNVDVSTVKEVYRRWFPDCGEPPQTGNHRALPDCYASLQELAWYRERLRVVTPIDMNIAYDNLEKDGIQ